VADCEQAVTYSLPLLAAAPNHLTSTAPKESVYNNGSAHMCCCHRARKIQT
jgi:hypothetical protein